MNETHALKLLSMLFLAGTTMRDNQRRFFKDRQRSALETAKDNEYVFDDILRQIEREFQFELETAQAHQPELIPQEKLP